MSADRGKPDSGVERVPDLQQGHVEQGAPQGMESSGRRPESECVGNVGDTSTSKGTDAVQGGRGGNGDAHVSAAGNLGLRQLPKNGGKRTKNKRSDKTPQSGRDLVPREDHDRSNWGDTGVPHMPTAHVQADNHTQGQLDWRQDWCFAQPTHDDAGPERWMPSSVERTHRAGLSVHLMPNQHQLQAMARGYATKRVAQIITERAYDPFGRLVDYPVVVVVGAGAGMRWPKVFRDLPVNVLINHAVVNHTDLARFAMRGVDECDSPDGRLYRCFSEKFGTGAFGQQVRDFYNKCDAVNSQYTGKTGKTRIYYVFEFVISYCLKVMRSSDFIDGATILIVREPSGSGAQPRIIPGADSEQWVYRKRIPTSLFYGSDVTDEDSEVFKVTVPLAGDRRTGCVYVEPDTDAPFLAGFYNFGNTVEEQDGQRVERELGCLGLQLVDVVTDDCNRPLCEIHCGGVSHTCGPFSRSVQLVECALEGVDYQADYETQVAIVNDRQRSNVPVDVAPEVEVVPTVQTVVEKVMVVQETQTDDRAVVDKAAHMLVQAVAVNSDPKKAVAQVFRSLGTYGGLSPEASSSVIAQALPRVRESVVVNDRISREVAELGRVPVSEALFGSFVNTTRVTASKIGNMAASQPAELVGLALAAAPLVRKIGVPHVGLIATAVATAAAVGTAVSVCGTRSKDHITLTNPNDLIHERMSVEKFAEPLLLKRYCLGHVTAKVRLGSNERAATIEVKGVGSITVERASGTIGITKTNDGLSATFARDCQEKMSVRLVGPTSGPVFMHCTCEIMAIKALVGRHVVEQIRLDTQLVSRAFQRFATFYKTDEYKLLFTEHVMHCEPKLRQLATQAKTKKAEQLLLEFGLFENIFAKASSLSTIGLFAKREKNTGKYLPVRAGDYQSFEQSLVPSNQATLQCNIRPRGISAQLNAGACTLFKDVHVMVQKFLGDMLSFDNARKNYCNGQPGIIFTSGFNSLDVSATFTEMIRTVSHDETEQFVVLSCDMSNMDAGVQTLHLECAAAWLSDLFEKSGFEFNDERTDIAGYTFEQWLHVLSGTLSGRVKTNGQDQAYDVRYRVTGTMKSGFAYTTWMNSFLNAVVICQACSTENAQLPMMAMVQGDDMVAVCKLKDIKDRFNDLQSFVNYYELRYTVFGFTPKLVVHNQDNLAQVDYLSQVFVPVVEGSRIAWLCSMKPGRALNRLNWLSMGECANPACSQKTIDRFRKTIAVGLWEGNKHDPILKALLEPAKNLTAKAIDNETDKEAFRQSFEHDFRFHSTRDYSAGNRGVKFQGEVSVDQDLLARFYRQRYGLEWHDVEEAVQEIKENQDACILVSHGVVVMAAHDTQ